MEKLTSYLQMSANFMKEVYTIHMDVFQEESVANDYNFDKSYVPLLNEIGGYKKFKTPYHTLHVCFIDFSNVQNVTKVLKTSRSFFRQEVFELLDSRIFMVLQALTKRIKLIRQDNPSNYKEIFSTMSYQDEMVKISNYLDFPVMDKILQSELAQQQEDCGDFVVVLSSTRNYGDTIGEFLNHIREVYTPNLELYREIDYASLKLRIFLIDSPENNYRGLKDLRDKVWSIEYPNQDQLGSLTCPDIINDSIITNDKFFPSITFFYDHHRSYNEDETTPHITTYYLPQYFSQFFLRDYYDYIDSKNHAADMLKLLRFESVVFPKYRYDVDLSQLLLLAGIEPNPGPIFVPSTPVIIETKPQGILVSKRVNIKDIPILKTKTPVTYKTVFASQQTQEVIVTSMTPTRNIFVKLIENIAVGTKAMLLNSKSYYVKNNGECNVIKSRIDDFEQLITDFSVTQYGKDYYIYVPTREPNFDKIYLESKKEPTSEVPLYADTDVSIYSDGLIQNLPKMRQLRVTLTKIGDKYPLVVDRRIRLTLNKRTLLKFSIIKRMSIKSQITKVMAYKKNGLVTMYETDEIQALLVPNNMIKLIVFLQAGIHCEFSLSNINRNLTDILKTYFSSQIFDVQNFTELMSIFATMDLLMLSNTNDVHRMLLDFITSCKKTFREFSNNLNFKTTEAAMILKVFKSSVIFPYFEDRTFHTVHEYKTLENELTVSNYGNLSQLILHNPTLPIVVEKILKAYTEDIVEIEKDTFLKSVESGNLFYVNNYREMKNFFIEYKKLKLHSMPRPRKNLDYSAILDEARCNLISSMIDTKNTLYFNFCERLAERILTTGHITLSFDQVVHEMKDELPLKELINIVMKWNSILITKPSDEKLAVNMTVALQEANQIFDYHNILISSVTNSRYEILRGENTKDQSVHLTYVSFLKLFQNKTFIIDELMEFFDRSNPRFEKFYCTWENFVREINNWCELPTEPVLFKVGYVLPTEEFEIEGYESDSEVSFKSFDQREEEFYFYSMELLNQHLEKEKDSFQQLSEIYLLIHQIKNEIPRPHSEKIDTFLKECVKLQEKMVAKVQKDNNPINRKQTELPEPQSIEENSEAPVLEELNKQITDAAEELTFYQSMREKFRNVCTVTYGLCIKFIGKIKNKIATLCEKVRSYFGEDSSIIRLMSSTKAKGKKIIDKAKEIYSGIMTFLSTFSTISGVWSIVKGILKNMDEKITSTVENILKTITDKLGLPSIKITISPLMITMLVIMYHVVKTPFLKTLVLLYGATQLGLLGFLKKIVSQVWDDVKSYVEDEELEEAVERKTKSLDELLTDLNNKTEICKKGTLSLEQSIQQKEPITTGTEISGNSIVIEKLLKIGQGLAKGIPCVVGGLGVGVLYLCGIQNVMTADKGKIGEEIINSAKNFHYLSSGMIGFEKLAIRIFGFFEWIFSKISTFWQSNSDKLWELKKKIMTFVQEASGMQPGFIEVYLMKDYSLITKVYMLMDQALEIEKEISKGYRDLEPSVERSFRMASKNIKELFPIAKALSCYISGREEVFHVQFSGIPGLGKTDVMGKIANFLGGVYADETGRDINTHPFVKVESKEFDDLNYGAEILIIDEMAATSKIEAKELATYLTFFSKTPQTLNHAVLQNKTIVNNTKIMVSATNNPYSKPEGVLTPEAIFRRRKHIKIEPSDPNKTIGDYSPTEISEMKHLKFYYYDCLENIPKVVDAMDFSKLQVLLSALYRHHLAIDYSRDVELGVTKYHDYKFALERYSGTFILNNGYSEEEKKKQLKIMKDMFIMTANRPQFMKILEEVKTVEKLKKELLLEFENRSKETDPDDMEPVIPKINFLDTTSVYETKKNYVRAVTELTTGTVTFIPCEEYVTCITQPFFDYSLFTLQTKCEHCASINGKCLHYKKPLDATGSMYSDAAMIDAYYFISNALFMGKDMQDIVNDRKTINNIRESALMLSDMREYIANRDKISLDTLKRQIYEKYFQTSNFSFFLKIAQAAIMWMAFKAVVSALMYIFEDPVERRSYNSLDPKLSPHKNRLLVQRRTFYDEDVPEITEVNLDCEQRLITQHTYRLELYDREFTKQLAYNNTIHIKGNLFLSNAHLIRDDQRGKIFGVKLYKLNDTVIHSGFIDANKPKRLCTINSTSESMLFPIEGIRLSGDLTKNFMYSKDCTIELLNFGNYDVLDVYDNKNSKSVKVTSNFSKVNARFMEWEKKLGGADMFTTYCFHTRTTRATPSGSCGMPICFRDRKHLGYIVGIFMAGTSDEEYFTHITRDMLEDAMKNFDVIPKVAIIQPLEVFEKPKEEIKYNEIAPELEFVGTHTYDISTGCHTKFVPTRVYKQIMEPLVTPAILGPKDKRYQKLLTMYDTVQHPYAESINIVNGNSKSHYYDEQQQKTFVEYLTNSLLKTNNIVAARTISIYEAIAGIPKPGGKPMNIKSYAGLKYAYSRKPGKTMLWKNYPDGRRDITDQFIADIDEYITTTNEGKIPSNVKAMFPKDETVTFNKVEDPNKIKTRLIGTGNAVHTAVNLMIIGDMARLDALDCNSNHRTTGINPVVDWDGLVNSLVKDDYTDLDRILEWDVKAWESTITEQELLMVAKAYIKVLKMAYEAREEPFPSWIEKTLLAIQIDMSSSYVCFENSVFYKTHGMLSGHPATLIMNSDVHYGRLAVAYKELMLKKNRTDMANWKSFNDNMGIRVAGDDVIISLTKRLSEIISHDDILEQTYRKRNIKVTAPDKGEVQGFINIRQAKFLKMGFNFELGLWKPNPDESIISGLLNYQRKTELSSDMQFSVNTWNAMSLAWFKGQTYYENLREKLNLILLKQNAPLFTFNFLNMQNLIVREAYERTYLRHSRTIKPGQETIFMGIGKRDTYEDEEFETNWN